MTATSPAAPVHYPMAARRRCLLARHQASGCRACAKACPSGALSVREKRLVFDPERCRGCGACMAACPADALIDPLLPHEDLLQQIEEASAAGGLVVVEDGVRLPHEPAAAKANVVTVPTVRRFGLLEFLFAALSGAKTIEIFERGTAAPDADPAGDAAARAQAIAAGLGRTFEVRRSVPEEKTASAAPVVMARAPVSPEAAAAALKAARSLEAEAARRMAPRQEALRRLLRRFAADADDSADSKETEGLRALLPQPVVNPAKCVRCGVCEAVCPTTALKVDRPRGGFVLSLTPALCSGCRLCADVCFMIALAMQPAATLRGALTKAPRTLLRKGDGAAAAADGSADEWESKLSGFFDAPVYRT